MTDSFFVSRIAGSRYRLLSILLFFFCLQNLFGCYVNRASESDLVKGDFEGRTQMNQRRSSPELTKNDVPFASGANTAKCGYSKRERALLDTKEGKICEAVSPYTADLKDNPFPLEITYVEIDLNYDGTVEIVAWESSWAGSSGGLLVGLSKSEDTFVRLFEITMTWSPILILESSNNGWRDIAFFQNGGGLKSGFITLTHNGKQYVEFSELSQVAPIGQILIEKSW